MNDATNSNNTTWSDVWEAATAATEQTVSDTKEWASENPTAAVGVAAAVGVGIGYLLFN